MFVRLGDNRVINLNNVVQIYKRDFDMKPCIQIDFIGPGGLYERFTPGSLEYASLAVWMSEQPTLLNEVGDA
jgi:hypothetical protein